MGVRPGRYELTVERSALASLRMVADTVRFELPPGPVGGGAAPSAEARLKAALKTPGPTISGLEVHLHRASAAQGR
jgi:hypothetical protein